MNIPTILSALNEGFLESEANINALVHLEDAIGSTLSVEYWLKDEFGASGAEFLTAIQGYDIKRPLTIYEVQTLFVFDISNDAIGGWNGRDVAYDGKMVSAYDIHTTLIKNNIGQEDATIEELVAAIDYIARTHAQRAEKQRDVEAVFEDIKYKYDDFINVALDKVFHIANPVNTFGLDGALSLGFVRWDGTRSVKLDQFRDKDSFVVRDTLYIEEDSYLFFKGECGNIFAIDEDQKTELFRKDGTNSI